MSTSSAPRGGGRRPRSARPPRGAGRPRGRALSPRSRRAFRRAGRMPAAGGSSRAPRRPLGLLLLHEREQRVEDDHRDDRAGEDGGARDEREGCGEPEQKRQRVDELLDELSRPASLGSAPELVRAVCDEPARGLAGRKALADAAGRSSRESRRARSGRRQRPAALGRARRVAPVSRPGRGQALFGRPCRPGESVCRQATSTAA